MEIPIYNLLLAVKDDIWLNRINKCSRFHVAIFKKPYLELILNGTKTMESRFSKIKCDPYLRVGLGDIILMKKSGGDIIGLFTVEKALCYELNPELLRRIKIDYGDSLCIDADFIKAKENSKYVTLIAIDEILKINPIKFEKADRRAWIVFDRRRRA